MHWLKSYAFGSHLVDWLALAAVVVLTLALRIAARRFIIGLLIRKREQRQRREELLEYPWRGINQASAEKVRREPDLKGHGLRPCR